MKRFTTLLSLLSVLVSFAQVPDPGFGSGGKVYQSFGSFHAELTAACLQMNGKIFSVGNHGLLPNRVLACRHNADGTPDNGFGNSGLVELTFGNTTGYVYSCLQATNTSLFLAGASDGKAALHFLNPDGSYNISFGTGGKLLIDFGAGNGARIDKILSYPNGVILGIGSVYNGTDFDFMAVRVNPGGDLDASFGNGGKVIVNVGGYNDFAMDGGFQSDGKIVLSGYSNSSSGVSRFSAIRLNTNGSLDESFANGGKWMYMLGNNYNNIEGLAIQEDDKIVLGGFKDDEMITFRLKADGTLDNSFQGNGYVITDFNGNAERAFDVEVQGDGKILTAGWITTDFGTNQYAVCRHNPDGSPDISFNGNGQFTYEMGLGGSWINQILMQYDNKLILCGLSSLTFGGFSQFSLLQLTDLSLSDKVQPVTSGEVVCYPNPVNDELYIVQPGKGSLDMIRIIDVHGKQLMEMKYTGMPVNTHDLPAGVYLLELLSGEGRLVTSRFLKL